MKTIDQDTIDFAYDFFFKLSDAQLKERIADFQKRQNFVHFMHQEVLKKIHSGTDRTIFWSYCMMVDYCYNNTFGELKKISGESILEFYDWRDKTQFDYVIDGDHIDFGKYYIEAGQEEFLAFMHNEIFKTGNDTEAKAMLSMLTMVFLYQKEIKRMSGLLK